MNNNLKTKNNNSLQWTHKCMKYRHILSSVWNIVLNFCTTFYPTSNIISWSSICISPPIKVKIFAFPSRTKVDSSPFWGERIPCHFSSKFKFWDVKLCQNAGSKQKNLFFSVFHLNWSALALKILMEHRYGKIIIFGVSKVQSTSIPKVKFIAWKGTKFIFFFFIFRLHFSKFLNFFLGNYMTL